MSTIHGRNYPCGNWLAYQHNPCHCQPCTSAWTRYTQQLELRHNRGDVYADTQHFLDLFADFVRDGVSPLAVSRAAGNTGKSTTVARKLMYGTGKVRKGSAAKYDGMTWDDLRDKDQVNADVGRELVAALRERGWSSLDIGRKVLGWTHWPHEWPTGGRVSLGSVRRLERALGRERHGWHRERPCDDCGERALPEGFFCLECLNLRTLPQTSRELELAARRREDRVRRALYREREDAA